MTHIKTTAEVHSFHPRSGGTSHCDGKVVRILCTCVSLTFGDVMGGKIMDEKTGMQAPFAVSPTNLKPKCFSFNIRNGVL